MTTRCEEVRPLLTDYVLQEVDASAAARIDAHVAACPGCRQKMAESRAMLGLLERTAVMEELPRNIRVVADSEPAQAEAPNWWAAFWNSAGRLAFAGGALACLEIGRAHV